MGVKKDYPNRDYYLKLIGTVITLLGFGAIIYQMNLFQTQNESLQEQSELLNRSLLQTYRPIGWISDTNPNSPLEEYKNVIVTGYTINITLKDSIVIEYKPYLVNEGNGVLVYLGHLYYISDTLYSFRERIQKGLIDKNDIRFDWHYSRARKTSILPGRHYLLNMKAIDVNYEPFYYFYALTLYEDQEGNLYDTESMLYFEYDKNKKQGERISKLLTRNLYNAYSDEEKSKLLNIINKRNHPMAIFFSNSIQPAKKVVKP